MKMAILIAYVRTLLRPKTELVTAWYLMRTKKRENHIFVYQHYVDCCEEHGMMGIRGSLDQMIVLDYLILNEDRHQNNFGVVRDAGTLEYLCAALQNRIEGLQRIMNSHVKYTFVDNISMDVRENIAYHGKTF